MIEIPYEYDGDKNYRAVAARHSLQPQEVGKRQIIDSVFYDGHVGFYDEQDVRQAVIDTYNRQIGVLTRRRDMFIEKNPVDGEKK